MGSKISLLPSGEKVARQGRMRGLVQHFLISMIQSVCGNPLIRLAPRATFSPEGRRI